ncbi:hypothetical protein ACA910_019028 [Epithemia clementina (nom. ined.)]
MRRSPLSPKFVEGLRDLFLVKISAGGKYRLSLTVRGQLFARGQGTEGQLGVLQQPSHLPQSGSGTVPSYQFPPTAQPEPRLVLKLDFVAIVSGQEYSKATAAAADAAAPGFHHHFAQHDDHDDHYHRLVVIRFHLLWNH